MRHTNSPFQLSIFVNIGSKVFLSPKKKKFSGVFDVVRAMGPAGDGPETSGPPGNKKIWNPRGGTLGVQLSEKTGMRARRSPTQVLIPCQAGRSPAVVLIPRPSSPVTRREKRKKSIIKFSVKKRVGSDDKRNGNQNKNIMIAVGCEYRKNKLKLNISAPKVKRKKSKNLATSEKAPSSTLHVNPEKKCPWWIPVPQ